MPSRSLIFKIHWMPMLWKNQALKLAFGSHNSHVKTLTVLFISSSTLNSITVNSIVHLPPYLKVWKISTSINGASRVRRPIFKFSHFAKKVLGKREMFRLDKGPKAEHRYFNCWHPKFRSSKPYLALETSMFLSEVCWISVTEYVSLDNTELLSTCFMPKPKRKLSLAVPLPTWSVEPNAVFMFI